MSKYRFDGTFQDTSWQGLPSPEDVKASLRKAIQDANPEVFEIRIDRVDISDVGNVLPMHMRAGLASAQVEVIWKVED